uniref:subtilisin n=1 Tax=Alexandrium monilatum TaxID=311494 RepID=A0A7S4QRP1_9DINO
MDGLMLACCDGRPTQDLVAFQSSYGRYMVAEEDGAVNCNRVEVDDWETFQILYNSDGTIALRTHFGKYVGADATGAVNARHWLIGKNERFSLVDNKDSTFSLQSSHGTYLMAELDGRLNANHDKIGLGEKFVMKDLSSPDQRFPNDVNFTSLWGMHELLDKDIDAPEAWKKFTGEFSAGITVAVIDTGIDYTHEDLRDNIWVNPDEIPGNGIDDDGNGIVDDVHGADFANDDGDPMDDQKHGTHCAGTIAGVGNNGRGVSGVAWHGVRLMALKFLSASGGGKTADAVKAIDYAAAHGARVASNSWGGGGSNAALRVAIERAEAVGMLFVAAAGNSRSDNDEDPHYPSNYPTDNIIAVASSTSKGKLSSFSCYGATTVDLAAPGSSIYSTTPKNHYQFLSGTSMATPHVTGLAALVWMYRPALSMMQVKDIILSSVETSKALEGKVLTGGRINARKALEAASAMEPPYPPVHAPRAVAFEDTDSMVGLIGGTVTVTAATDESDVLYYRVYFVSRAGYQLDSLGSVNATGAKLLEVPISKPRAVPQFAVGLVAVSGNATGEMPAQIGGGCPNITVEDFIVPQSGPQAVSWGGDVDLRRGIVAGKLSVTRATDEESITQYNVYWSNGSDVRGPLVGSVPANGFALPKCTGRTCPLINTTLTKDGSIVYDRTSYRDMEMAIIEASGPALVEVTRFHTESYYDTLTIGAREISGSPGVPMNVEVPKGRLRITWSSDESITSSGWTFRLQQSGETAEFQVTPAVPLGRGLEIVPAYGNNESPKGIFVKVMDYDSTMPPSPGFAPSAVDFTDVNNASGIVQGVAEVVPAPGVEAADSVAYFQLDFADADGNAIVGLGVRADAKGNHSVLIPIAATPLPAGASQLIARAGNSFGLSTGRMSIDLVDLAGVPESTAMKVADAVERPEGVRLEEALKAAPKAKELPEPWLQRPVHAEERKVAWTATSPAALTADGAVESHVLCTVELPDVEAEAVVGQKSREALRDAIHAGLPFVGKDGVRVTKVLAKTPAAAEHGSPRSRRAAAATAEFRVEPSQGAPPHAVDRIEARLILLGMGGPSAKRFSEELVKRLRAVGVRLPAGARVHVGLPQQVLRRRPGRALTAAAAVVLGDESSAARNGPHDDEVPLLTAATAALVAALVSVLTVVLVRTLRNRRPLVEKKGLVALDGVRVQPDGTPRATSEAPRF